MKERREHQRYSLPLRVSVEVVSDSEVLTEESRFIDIGPGGASFSLKADVRTGSIVGLTIPDIKDGFNKVFGFPSGGGGPLNIKLQGEVLRSEKSKSDEEVRQVAVRFCGPLRVTLGADNATARSPIPGKPENP